MVQSLPCAWSSTHGKLDERGRNFYFVVVCCCRSNPSPTPFTFNSLPELYEFIYIPPPPTLFNPPTPYNHQLELLACAEVLLLFVALLMLLLEVLLLPGQPAHRSNWHNLNNFHLDFPQKRRLRTWLWRLLINAVLWTSSSSASLTSLFVWAYFSFFNHPLYPRHL